MSSLILGEVNEIFTYSQESLVNDLTLFFSPVFKLVSKPSRVPQKLVQLKC